MKNAMLIIISGLLIITIAGTSCTKTSLQVIAPTITGFSPVYDTIGGIITYDTIGEKITITGTGFTGTNTVSFGGTPAASFKVESADTIIAILGLGATGKVAVSTPGGTATYSGFMFQQIYCGCNSSNDIADTSLIAHWPFDGSPNEIISQLPPMLTGGSATYVKGRIGQAISLTNGWLTYSAGATFAGIANSILNTNDTLQNGFSITLWAQLPTTVKSDTLLTNLFQLSSYPGIPNWPLAGIALKKFPDSTLLFGGLTNKDSSGIHPSYDSASFKSYVADTAQWAFIALVYDSIGRSLQYYYDGVLVGQSALFTGAVSGSVFPYSEPLLLPTPNYATIGAFESSATFPLSSDQLPTFMNPGLTGVLDDIRFFNTTLTAYNISDLYILGIEGK